VVPNIAIPSVWIFVNLTLLVRNILRWLLDFCGSGSVAGIATGYGLDGPEIETPVGARFSAPVQTGPGAHPASCTIPGLSRGVKSGRGVTLTSHPLLVPLVMKE